MILSLAIHNFLRKSGKVTIFRPPTILTLPYKLIRNTAFANGKREKPRKWKFLENPKWQITIADYWKIRILLGIPRIENPTTEKIAMTLATVVGL